MVNRYRYDAWGNLEQHQGTSQQPFGFTGYQNDNNTGLYYAQQRYYNPASGRFLSHDPFAGDINTPISLHRYLYANASPAVFVDPTGEVPILSHLANGFDRFSANRIEAAARTASLRNDNILNNVAIATGGFGNGVISGASGILGAAFGVINFGANIAVRNVLPDSTAIAGQVDVELDQGFRTLDTVTTTASSFAQIAVEDPVQAGAIAVSVTASLAESAGSVLHQAFIEGDPGAAAKTSAFVTEAVLTGGGARTIARNAGKALLNASNKAKSLATATIDKAKRAAQAVTNAAAQAAKSAQVLAQRASSQLRTIAESFNESVNQRLFGGSTVFDPDVRVNGFAHFDDEIFAGTPIIKKVEGIDFFREIEIIDATGKPVGEFDEIDLQSSTFFEDKSATGLNRVNPRTGLPAQTPQQFAEKQILQKTRNRINNLNRITVATRATRNGTSTAPTLEQIQIIRNFVFRLDGDGPELKIAVDDSLKQLRLEFPDFNFSATLGAKK